MPVPLSTTALALSRDGRFLGVGAEKIGLYVWDLERLRAGLGSVGLDWEGPPYLGKSGPQRVGLLRSIAVPAYSYA